MCGPSSGCDLTYRAAIQDVWDVLLGYWGLGGGEELRSRCFNSGYHDLVVNLMFIGPCIILITEE